LFINLDRVEGAAESVVRPANIEQRAAVFNKGSLPVAGEKHFLAAVHHLEQRKGTNTSIKITFFHGRCKTKLYPLLQKCT
jgi:hypothetical protein